MVRFPEHIFTDGRLTSDFVKKGCYQKFVRDLQGMCHIGDLLLMGEKQLVTI